LLSIIACRIVVAVTQGGYCIGGKYPPFFVFTVPKGNIFKDTVFWYLFFSGTFFRP